jgi:hypothetical protein
VQIPEPKVFKLKFPQLPVLEDYKVITSDEFWGKFPSNLVQPAVSNINAARLAACLEAAGVPLTADVQKVLG